MGWRFRRTVRIVPGVGVNFGKRGASFSFGPRGAKVTVGANGVRHTVGLPGSGLSYSTYSQWSRPTGTLAGAAQPKGPAPEPSGFGSWLKGLFDSREKARNLLRTALREVDAARASDFVAQALALDSTSADTLVLYAAYLEQTGMWSGAYDVYARVVAQRPYDEYLALDFISAGLNCGKYADLAPFVGARLSFVNPDTGLGQVMLALTARVYLGIGDPSTALAVVNRAPLRKKLLDEPLLMCLLVRAETHIAGGQKAKARKDLDRVRAADPLYPGLSVVEGRL